MSHRSRMKRGRVAAAVRAGWGGALLLVPGKIVGIGGQLSAPRSAVAIARMLGLRQLLQAAVTAVAPTGRVAGLSAAVDALHAGTDVGFAAASPRWRRIAAADAVIATAFAAASWSCRGDTPLILVQHGGQYRLRDLARTRPGWWNRRLR
jgi:hypothetical protein